MARVEYTRVTFVSLSQSFFELKVNYDVHFPLHLSDLSLISLLILPSWPNR